MTDYASMTPPEIDNILVAAMTDFAGHQHTVETRTKHITVFKERIDNITDTGLLGASEKDYWQKRLAKAQSDLEQAEKDVSEALKAMERIQPTMDACWKQYGSRPWNRYFLVMNPGGHIHSSMNCSTTFDQTRWSWLPDQAGLAVSELVELAGEKACTVCFPDAPVDVRNRPSKLEAPERKAAREQKAAEKAERERIKAEKAITAPDGSQLRMPGRFGSRVDTVHEAERRLVANMAEKMAVDAGKYEVYNREFLAEKEEEVRLLFAALVHKFRERMEAESQSEDDLMAAYRVRAEKKLKRDWK